MGMKWVTCSKFFKNGRRTVVHDKPYPRQPDDIIAALDRSKNSSHAPILVFWINYRVFLPILFLVKFKFNLDMMIVSYSKFDTWYFYGLHDIEVAKLLLVT
jgi:hypothetical protein